MTGIIAANWRRIFMLAARACSLTPTKRSNSRVWVSSSRIRAAPTMFSVSTRFSRSMMP